MHYYNMTFIVATVTSHKDSTGGGKHNRKLDKINQYLSEKCKA